MKLLFLFFLSMVPIIELRGAVPMGIAWGYDFFTVYIISVIGNLVPVPILIPFAGKVLKWGSTLPKVGFIFQKIIDMGNGKIKKITKTLMAALFLFVAIPAPGTGAWTGCLIATLLNLPLKKAFWPIALGVCAAGLIMGIGSYGILGLFQMA